VESKDQVPDITHILEHHVIWAYVILLVWTFLEGETIVIIAGIAARDGQLMLPLIILCAFCGSLCSDQIAFLLGRHKGKAFIARRPKWQARAEKVYRMLEYHQTWLILGFRFMYGLRNITPFVIGMSEVRTRRFVVLNVIGSAVWATSFTLGGYLFGAAMERFMAKEQKWAVMIGLAAIAFIAWAVRRIRRRAIKPATLDTVSAAEPPEPFEKKDA
jgi:membrane protein DedA with SNARE-associated domain